MEGSAANEWITAFGGSWWSMCPTRLLTSAVPFQTYEDGRWDAVAREQRRLDRNLTDRRRFQFGLYGRRRWRMWSEQGRGSLQANGPVRATTREPLAHG